MIPTQFSTTVAQEPFNLGTTITDTETSGAQPSTYCRDLNRAECVDQSRPIKVEPGTTKVIGSSKPNQFSRTKSEVAIKLGILGDDAHALPLIASIYQDTDWLVRRDAAEALGQIETEHEQALNQLELMTTDKDPFVREYVAIAILQQAKKLFELGQTTKAVNLEPSAARAIEKAFTLLMSMKNDPDESIRGRVAEGLGYINKAEAFKELKSIMENDSGSFHVRAGIANALFAIAKGGETPELRQEARGLLQPMKDDRTGFIQSTVQRYLQELAA